MGAALQALRFRSGSPELLHSVPQHLRTRLLEFTDRTQLTLAIGQRWDADLPDWLEREIRLRRKKNASRWERIKAAYSELASALAGASLDPVVLKGFSGAPDFFPNPALRVQYDIDFLFSPTHVTAARDAILPIGYHPAPFAESNPTDHLPVMVRRTNWEWKGDFFDPDIPISVDLHFRLWDPDTECISIPGLDDFLSRVQPRNTDGLSYKALARPDALACAALHMLRHLLRGSLRPSHGYELAWFLQHAAADGPFWARWVDWHAPELKQLQAVCFALVHRWYECVLPPQAQDEISRLPVGVLQWLDEFGYSPLNGLNKPRKDEIWLHLALVADSRARVKILRRRLFPSRLPGPIAGVSHSEKQTLRTRIQNRLTNARFILTRVSHHARALVSFTAGAVRWKTKLPAPFWWYLGASAFFDVGLFTFFLLYNIYLLQLGFSEQMIGSVSGAMTAGSLAGSLFAAWALRLWDIRRCLMATLLVLAAASAIRCIVTAPAALFAFAAVCGAATSVWAVSLAPTVALLAGEDVRPRAFSFVFATGIGLGVLGGLLGGSLPGLLLPLAGSGIASLRLALCLSCCVVAVGTLLLRKLPAERLQPERRGPVRVNSFLRRYLTAMALWHLGTGAFNPFFSPFFVRLGLTVPQIGGVFSLAQAVQTCAVLVAPAVLKRSGLVRGVSLMQLATGGVLLALGFSANPLLAAALYPAYMAVQYMSEPGMYSLLMDAIAPEGRGTASALNFAVAFGSQAIASTAAGWFITRHGYLGVTLAAAILCAASALGFLLLRSPGTPSSASAPPSGSETDPTSTDTPTPVVR